MIREIDDRLVRWAASVTGGFSGGARVKHLIAKLIEHAGDVVRGGIYEPGLLDDFDVELERLILALPQAKRELVMIEYIRMPFAPVLERAKVFRLSRRSYYRHLHLLHTDIQNGLKKARAA